MDNIILQRQSELDLNIDHSLLIVGCGGVGSWAAIFAALSGVKTLILLDPDTLELHNLNRLPFSPDDVGQRKVHVLRNYILKLRPDAEVYAIPAQFSPLALSSFSITTVIDATDNLRAQREISLWAEARGIQYVRAGYNGTHITVSGQGPVWATEDDPGGYDIVPSWAVPAAIAGALAVARIEKYPELTISNDIGALK